MNMTYEAQRALYVNARSLILKALDIMDQAYNLGKYKSSAPLPPTDTATFSGIIESTPRVDVATAETKG